MDLLKEWLSWLGQAFAQQWIALISLFIATRAFLWQRQDRQEKKHGKKPSIHIEKLEGWRPVDNFLPLQITFSNENPFAIVVTQISLLSPKDGKLAIGGHLSLGEMSVDSSAVAKTLKFNVTIPPSLETGVVSIKTGTPKLRPVCFIGCNTLEEGSSQSEMSFTYHSILRKDKNRTIKITSAPIEFSKSNP